VEIHAPDKPILTLKEALVHLSIVTVGILIALSLEGTLEWVRHRALVRETRQSLTGEMRDNERDIQFLQAALDKTLPRFQHAIDVVSDLSVPDKLKEAAGIFSEGSGPDRLLSDWIISWPDSASHATAEATGAFELMPYSEAHRYSDIYEAQALYGRAQDGEIKDVMTAWSFGQAMLKKPTPAEVEDLKRQLRVAIGSMVSVKQFANALNGRYKKILQPAQ
jgi:hypothetical protein